MTATGPGQPRTWQRFILPAIVGLFAVLVLAVSGSEARASQQAGQQTNHPQPASPIISLAQDAQSTSPDGCTPTQLDFYDSLTTNDPVQYGALASITASVCEPRNCPGVIDNLPRHYKEYTFTNVATIAQCVTITLDATGCRASDNPSIPYSGYLNSEGELALDIGPRQPDPCTGYVGDMGAPTNGVSSYSIPVPAGQRIIVVVSEASPGTLCASYHLTVDGCVLYEPPPTATPTETATQTATQTATRTATGTATRTATSEVTGTATQATTATGTTTALATTTTCTQADFPDVPPGSTFYQWVHCLACRGIVSGYPNGTFGPNNPVTRGQLSKIVSNSADYNENHTNQTFEDVAVGSTFYQFIERLASRNIIQGYACGGLGEPCVPPDNRPYFRPGANVSRGQTSKIVAVAANLSPPPSGQQTFEDVPEGSPFWMWIEPLATSGAIQGYACGGIGEPCVPPDNRPYFRPGANVSRGQSAKIVASTFFPGCNP